MSRVIEEFECNVSATAAASACRTAAARKGWNLLPAQDGMVTILTPMKMLSSAGRARIEIVLSESAEATTITINGQIAGAGPIQKRHLQGHITYLRGEIESNAEHQGAA